MDTMGAGGPVRGTQTDDDAAAGYVGEFIEVKRLAASALSLTSNADATVISLSGDDALTPGDWDVNGQVGIVPAATTSFTRITVGLSLTDNAQPAADDTCAVSQWASAANVLVNAMALQVGPRRVKVPAGATDDVFLTTDVVFTVSTASSFGQERARRTR